MEIEIPVLPCRFDLFGQFLFIHSFHFLLLDQQIGALCEQSPSSAPGIYFLPVFPDEPGQLVDALLLSGDGLDDGDIPAFPSEGR